MLLYVPLLVYSIAGAGWMLWHNIAAIVLLFVWMMIVGLFGLLMGSLGTASICGGLAACHLLAALAPLGVATPPLAVVKEMVGDGARQLIRRALARAGVEGDLDALHATFL